MAFPSKVAAVGISKTGDVDVIQNLDLPFPSPAPNQFAIKLRDGNFPLPTLPTALGVEAAGTIVALPTDESVLNSEAFQRRGFEIGGKVAFRKGLSPRQGAASLVQGLTALTFTSEAYDVRRGDRVLVHTVAGGLGLWFAQLCKRRGAVVIGTMTTAEKATVARAHGADHVILYRDEDVAARVLEITGGALTAFGILIWDRFEGNLKAIRAKGTIVGMDSASGKIEAFDPKVLYAKNIKFVYPSATLYIQQPENGRDYGQELVDLLASGAVKPVISKEYPFMAEGVAQAHKDLAEGRSVGKLLIKVASD
ncbi:hypothetical protein V8D89_003225 [Ganoderma adspersum]